MDSLGITKTEAGFHIEGFPDAVKVIKIGGPKAKRLADLALHRQDLEFALSCLEGVNQVQETMLREGLYHSAIVHYLKCFGGNRSRFSLNAARVYKQDSEAIEAFNFFSSLRNKHLVHDENSFAQALPGAVLNKSELSEKIAKIVCLSTVGYTLGQENYSNLHLLITRALQWVTKQFDELCNEITSELESETYDNLFATEGITYSKPKLEDIDAPRSALA